MHSHFDVKFPASGTDLELALVRTYLTDKTDEVPQPPLLGGGFFAGISRALDYLFHDPSTPQRRDFRK